MEFVRNSFLNLFTTDFSSSPIAATLNDSACPQLSDDESHLINLPVTDEEIKHAVWFLKAFKSPGPDGLHAGFYQRFWLIVGRSVTEEIKNIFRERTIPLTLNQTHIALIPKIKGPESIGSFRPISLCNTIYKVITKIIVARIRPLLDKLVSPFQSAFVPGRKGVDNAVIAQELIHTISRKKGKVGYMVVKIDLEKAYDRLEWSFIREVLYAANFPPDLIQLIMSCVSSATTSVLFNGGVLDPFLPSRGIRQGDPLSPYLFILCMEVLGRIIEDKCSNKLWCPVKASTSGPAFSHLFFADDLLLFAKVDPQNCLAVREALDEFCLISGQKINPSKSKVFFSPNINEDLRTEYCEVLGFQPTNNLGSYLGFPIRHAGSSNQDLNFVLDKVSRKLAGWKANLLSFAGRRVLIQASTSAIPSYVMQTTYLPNRILDNLDRLNKNFLWGSSDVKRKMHWVGWGKITQPITKGGLGLQSAKGRNLAYLSKLNWRLHSEKDALWAQVMRKKYLNPRRTSSNKENSLPSSRTWKALKKGMDTFQKGTRWSLGRDSNLSVWHDSWTSHKSLRSLMHGPLIRGEDDLKVKDMATVNGWDWGKISMVLPANVCREIQAMPRACIVNNEDKLIWAASPNGDFNLNSAYSIANKEGQLCFNGKWIWKIPVLPRIQFFLWMCCHNSLATRERLATRGIQVNIACPICSQHPETIIHLLRDCHVASTCWQNLGMGDLGPDFYSSDLYDWLEENCKQIKPSSHLQIPWSILFSFGVWILWNHRNRVVFKNTPPSLSIHKEIIQRAAEFTFCAKTSSSKNPRVERLIRWERPGRGWFKLNTDGASLGNPGAAGGGGIIRNDVGIWVKAFVRNIGNTTSFLVELWALRDGLQMCQQMHINALEVELDAKVISDLMNNSRSPNATNYAIVADCRALISQIPQVKVIHCYREGNCCADGLARIGCSLSSNFLYFSYPPPSILDAYMADLYGLSKIRLCPVSAVL